MIRRPPRSTLFPYTSSSDLELFGVHDWSTRLPLMLGILAWLLAAYALGRHAYGERGGFYSAIVLATRSEEHTSELQSRLHLVCRLLLEKKKIDYLTVDIHDH